MHENEYVIQIVPTRLQVGELYAFSNSPRDRALTSLCARRNRRHITPKVFFLERATLSPFQITFETICAGLATTNAPVFGTWSALLPFVNLCDTHAWTGQSKASIANELQCDHRTTLAIVTRFGSARSTKDQTSHGHPFGDGSTLKKHGGCGSPEIRSHQNQNLELRSIVHVEDILE